MYENMSSLNLLGVNELFMRGWIGQEDPNSSSTRKDVMDFATLLASFSRPEKQAEETRESPLAFTGIPAIPAMQRIISATAAQGRSYESPINGIAITPSRSQQEIVQAVGNENTALIEKINSATSMEERMALATEMRDKIIAALKAGGYTAESTGSIDKISINGQLIDVLQNIKTLGANSRVQYLEVTGSNTSAQNDPVGQAILTATQSSIELLMELRTTNDPTQRHEIAQRIRTQLIEDLNASGYNTTAIFGSMDKITVNGHTYDFLAGLNTNSSQTFFQALKI